MAAGWCFRENGSQGLTVVAEHPVYIEDSTTRDINQAHGAVDLQRCQRHSIRPCHAVGNVGFGATPGRGPCLPLRAIAGSVMFLSNAWNDIRSFINPLNAGQAATLP